MLGIQRSLLLAAFTQWKLLPLSWNVVSYKHKFLKISMKLKFEKMKLWQIILIHNIRQKSKQTLRHTRPYFIQYSSECYLIFALRLNTSTLNHHFFTLPTIRLKHQKFVIRLADQSRIGTPICRSLVPCTKSLLGLMSQSHVYSPFIGSSY